MINNGMRTIYPGEILREDLVLLGLSVNALANALRVPATRLRKIVKERRSITPDTALRCAWRVISVGDAPILAESANRLRLARD